ncbi:hypothetical protein [Confluentibacter lentus]|uniref:hypothetical protein n=1 Tax=Confluentibacter lentus TaxID=1699412 RepID=UPI0012FDA72A|nr:hypothetical protein [Confluentibacter lentus]
MDKILSLAGAGNTKKHQEAIAELLYALIKKTKTVKKYGNFKVLPEITLDSKIPDIVVYNYSRDLYTPVAIFEFCNSNGLIKDLEKCNVLMVDNIKIKEAFVIDVSNDKLVFNKLYRLKNGAVSKPKNISKFEVLNIDLSNIV